MPNLLDYLNDSQFDNFYDYAPNELDVLALTELAYLPFDGLLENTFDLDTALRLDELAQAFTNHFQGKYPPLSMVTKERLELLEKLATSKRFKHIKALAYVNDYDLEQEKQFSAISYKLGQEDYLIAFRGTDDTLIGWKEDFHLTYMMEIPAQKSAKVYLKEALEQLEGQLLLSGHSKGGNLATYAATFQTTNLQERIHSIYSFDAPGLHQDLLTSQGFLNIAPKIHSIIPKDSIVGMFLATPEISKIVSSKASGLAQHITFNWEVQDRAFKTVQELSQESFQLDQTIKTWTSSLTTNELRIFFDSFFDSFIEAGVHRFSDLADNPLEKLQKINANHQNRPPQEKEIISRLIRHLFDTRIQVWKENQKPWPFLKQKEEVDKTV